MAMLPCDFNAVGRVANAILGDDVAKLVLFTHNWWYHCCNYVSMGLALDYNLVPLVPETGFREATS